MSAPLGPHITFTVFPNLPFELRCMIWQATCRPRVVELEYDEEDGFTPRSPGPIALRVCKESRDNIIQSYPLCFGSIFHPAKTRFNFSLDTLYIGSELEENVPHFFSTFGPLEISSLQVLALEDCYNETILPYEITLTTQLQKMVEKFTALRELLIVYDVVEMTDRTINCSDGHTMELHAELPQELSHPSVKVDQLPKHEDPEAQSYKLWMVKTCKPVYGWRRCPHGVAFSDLDLDLEDNMSDEERYGLYGPWGGPPPSMAYADMFGGPLDSDDEELFGYREDFDDEEDEDENDEAEDEDDDISVDSVD
ncbi:hypothetical protein BKA65DRAFT_129828 [Rhexocercosporidium sp. MPI-PUGE-AT-0058]|nr:hypothetical protein BKA65DRAFT_129828 [Rhexocercosporidium sp. MPI-PUGE-AT-0058]